MTGSPFYLPHSDARMEIAHCTPDLEPSWDDYLQKHPNATHCHLSAWRRVVTGTYGHKDYYLLARTGSGVCGVLPLVFMKGFAGKGSLISVPYLTRAASLQTMSK